ncbi:Unknown protein sequence [Pseudomonas coronafaciens pv. porri]|nr:Unknown protein sequence [Pseudomonas coronafaciens pv. porri]
MGFPDIQTNTGLEPLTLTINQRHQRYGRIAQGGGEQHYVVEVPFREAVQDVEMLERQDSIFLVSWEWCRAMGHEDDRTNDEMRPYDAYD